MAWTLEYEAKARKQLRKLPTTISERLLDGLETIASQDNPRDRGLAMAGDWAGHWRYRIGDYRVIARIDDGKMVILVVALGHRREIHRG